ncbi:Fic family protein [Lacticaseibacillus songhuajiangensis]|uniref:Fic family protein n=1 Tax=Lacticaseibacillus songhuajiangensis TaxID=1296539 RepID=UPI000F78D0DB|nr:Fic family protein [Lacticaseibacillus songhuajiangensis]
MANYKLLSKFKYGQDGRSRLSDADVASEYQNRINSYSAVKTNMYPRLDSKSELDIGLRTGKSLSTAPFPAFWVVTPTHLQKIDKLRNQSIYISEITSPTHIPQVAVESYLSSLLTNEIFFTNEIEGVHTNFEEISTIVWDSDTDSKSANRRLESTIRQYQTALKGEQKQINSLQDFRQLYDELLKGEIDPENLPDGKLFRNSFVFIGKGQGANTQAVHLPPDNEAAINIALSQLIDFMNNEDITAIDKALVTHFMFENTHPFKDGNGRTGRYLLATYLAKKTDTFTGLTISTSIHNHIQKYYRLFQEADDIENKADLTLFIDGMLDIIIDGQLEVIAQITRRIQELKDNMDHIRTLYPAFDDDYKNVIYLFLQSKLFTNSKKDGIQDRKLFEVVNRANKISRRTFKDIIDDLVAQHIIITIKSNPMQHVLADNLLIQ